MIFGYPVHFFFYEGLLALFLVSFLLILITVWDQNIALIRKAIIADVCIFALLVLGYGSFIEPKNLVVNEFEIQDERMPSLRIAVISDIHVGPYRKSDWVQKVVDRVNALQDIDLVLMPGDFVYGRAEKFVGELAPLKNLAVSLKFATLGNHDYDIVEPENSLQSQAVSFALEENGIQELKNESYFWGDKGLWILGMDDNYLGYHDWEATFRNTLSFPKILLAHSPDIMDEVDEEYLPDLIISGHTHCGQIRLPWLGALPFTIPTENGKKYERHLYEKKGTKIFISCGVGETGPRARLFNPPEIDVLDIN